MSQKTDVHLLVIVAGTNDPSNCDTLAESFIKGIHEGEDVIVEKVRLKDLSIDHFSLEYYKPDADQGKDFTELQKKIESADGIVIASPIWNFAVPAHLKNLIDRMGSFCLDPETHTKGLLGNKPFHLILTAGAGMFVWNTVMENSTSFLREGIKYFGGTVIGTHFEPKCTLHDRTFGLVVDKRPESLMAVQKKGKDFALIVKNFAANGSLPALSKGKSLFYNTAQWVVKRMT